MILKLIMIMNKNFNKGGAKIATLFQNFITKKCPSESKMGLRDLSLNSEKGVLAPSWRKMGSKKCHRFSEQNKFVLMY